MEDLQTKGAARALLEDIYHTHTEKISVKKRKNRDSRILIFVIVLGISGLAFGFWRMGNVIQRPMHMLTASDIKSSYSGSDVNEKLAISSSEPLSKDTDGDGLIDSDELNIFNTSPYLEDTDSDGINDFDEIKKGTDPNCLGNNCEPKIQGQNPTTPGQNTQNMAPQGETSAAYLRSLLIMSGINSADVQKLSDTEILDIYNSTMASGNNASSPIANLNTSKASSNIGFGATSDLQKMPPAELREFLKKGGMSEEMLNTFSDEEILQVLKETTGEQK